MLYSLRYPTLLLLLLPFGLAALACTISFPCLGTIVRYLGLYYGGAVLVNVVLVPLLYLLRHVCVVRPQLALAHAT